MKRSWREHVPSVLVATLSTAFGVSLLETAGVLSQAISSDDVTGAAPQLELMLRIVASVFIAIAIYVSAIVTANAFSTVIAGRTSTIALLRLLGSSAAKQRTAVAREGLLVGIAGAIIGAVFGTLATLAFIGVSVAQHAIPALDYTPLSFIILLPMAAVILTTWIASWVGARSVLAVSPIAATGMAVEKTTHHCAKDRRRNVTAALLFLGGVALLVFGVVIGLVSEYGILIGVLGGIVSFSGVIYGANWIMPVMLRATGRIFGRSAPAQLAAQNAVRYPERSSRSTIGLVIGVTLITMFAVAEASFSSMIKAALQGDPAVYLAIEEMLTSVLLVFSILVGFSALIAAIGMVNTISLSVHQRTRELGLLRSLGFSVRQVRSMIFAESAQMTIASVSVGLALGSFYGWAGAQSLLGSLGGAPGLIAPVIPVELVIWVAACSLVLVAAASLSPSRRATDIAPVAALAAT